MQNPLTQAKQGIHSLLAMAGRCAAIRRRAGLHHASWLLGKTNASTPDVPPSFIFPQLSIAEHDAVWCRMSLGQLSWWCSTPCQLLLHPQPACWWGEEHKRPWLRASTAQQQLKHPCLINAVFHTDPKHSPILATVKKISSIPAKTGTKSGMYRWHINSI